MLCDQICWKDGLADGTVISTIHTGNMRCFGIHSMLLCSFSRPYHLLWRVSSVLVALRIPSRLYLMSEFLAQVPRSHSGVASEHLSI